MANLKISAMTAAGALTGAEEFPIVQAGANRKLPLSALNALYQPLDSDLTAIAALTTTAFGRDFLTRTDSANARSYIGLGSGDAVTFGAGTFGGNVVINGDLTVNSPGTNVVFNTSNLTVDDPLIKMADGNTGNVLDIGFFGQYQPAATPLYAGLFLDATDGKFKLFSGLQSEPTTTVDTGGTGYAAAPLLIGALEATTGAFSSNLTVSGVAATLGSNAGASATLSINAAAATTRQINFNTAGVARWIWQVDNTAESGSDAGSRLNLLARNDAGGAIDSPFICVRASAGAITLGGTSARPITATGNFTAQGTSHAFGANANAGTTLQINAAAGNNRQMQFRTAGALRWNILATSAAESGSDAGSEFNLAAYNDAGTFIDNPLIFVRASGGTMTLGGTSARTVSLTGHLRLAAASDIIDANNNELLQFVQTASAVNEFTIANAATGGVPTLSATGGDTNVSIDLVPKGTHITDSTVRYNGIEIGYRGIPQNSQSAAYTTVAADRGKHILHPSADTTARTFTIDSNANVPYPIGTAITFINQNGAGTVTIAITSDTLRLAGAGTTGSRTLAANGIATAVKVTATEWIISGTGLT